MKILFSPVHYAYDEVDRGSEISWAFNLVDKLSNYLDEITVITGFKSVLTTKKYKIIEVNKNHKIIDLSPINSLFFNIKYTFLGYYILLTKKFDIHHHVLPFSIGKTFDLTKILFGKRGIKYIIGPIQSPIKDFDDNISDFNQKKSSYLKLIINSFLINTFSKILEKLSINTLNKADQIVVIDQLTKNKLKNMGIDKNKINIIPPGVDIDKFKCKTKYSITNKTVFLSVSYLIKRKNIKTIIEAMSILKDKQKDFTLLIVGDGPEKKSLVNLTKQLNLEKNISFLGFIPNNKIKDLYLEADVFISMSNHESWGQTYLEAMASGLPIISARNQGSLSILKPSFSCLVNDTSRDLAKVLDSFSKDKKTLKLMGQRARFEAETSYDWDRTIVPQYLNIYKKMIA